MILFVLFLKFQFTSHQPISRKMSHNVSTSCVFLISIWEEGLKPERPPPPLTKRICCSVAVTKYYRVSVRLCTPVTLLIRVIFFRGLSLSSFPKRLLLSSPQCTRVQTLTSETVTPLFELRGVLRPVTHSTCHN